MKKGLETEEIVIIKEVDSSIVKDMRYQGMSLMRFIGAVELKELNEIIGWATVRALRHKEGEYDSGNDDG